MNWVAGIFLAVPTVIGAVVLTNLIATRALNTRPVGMWGAKTA